MHSGFKALFKMSMLCQTQHRQFPLSSSRENTGVNGNPPVPEIDPSIGSHIKLQLLDITLLLSACSDGLDKKCLPKRMLL